MKEPLTFTVTGKYWHYHLIGVGIILTYSETAKQVFFINEATGVILQTVDMSNIGGYQSKEDFIRDSKQTFQHLIEKEKVNLNHELMDDPTIIETKTGGVGIDLNLIKN